MTNLNENGVQFEESDYDSDFTKKVIVQKKHEEQVGFLIKILIRSGIANNRKQAESVLILIAIICFFVGMLFLKYN